MPHSFKKKSQNVSRYWFLLAVYTKIWVGKKGIVSGKRIMAHFQAEIKVHIWNTDFFPSIVLISYFLSLLPVAWCCYFIS